MPAQITCKGCQVTVAENLVDVVRAIKDALREGRPDITCTLMISNPSGFRSDPKIKGGPITIFVAHVEVVV